ncbi:MAG: hypothetical protein IKX85_03385, partial [Clostridia bacterium]|nr:hypothetical protein [Clostridia bacterium]
MKKRFSLLALALLVLMLPSCLGPAAETGAPASESAPGSAESEPSSESERLTPEGTYLPPEDWSGGELYPYPALYPYWITSANGNGYASDYILYGLADAEGRIVTDPYFSDFRAVTADDGTRLLFLAHDAEDPVEFLTAVYGPDSSRWPDGYDGSRADFEMLLLAGDGSWRTPAVPRGGVLCYAGENRVVWQDPAEKSAVLYSTAGEKIALSRGISVDLYTGGSGGSGYHILPLFSAGWLPVAVKGGSLGAYRNGYNFVDPDGDFLFAEDRSAVNNFDEQGYAAVFDPETGKCGIVDNTGAYTVKPTYEHPLIPAAAGAGLYAYAENGKNDYYKGILRADTG